MSREHDVTKELRRLMDAYVAVAQEWLDCAEDDDYPARAAILNRFNSAKLDLLSALIPALPALLSEAEEAARLRGLLWFAWREFNAIRARDGAANGVSEEWWSEMTDMFNRAIGPDAAKPWPSAEAMTILTNRGNDACD